MISGNYISCIRNKQIALVFKEAGLVEKLRCMAYIELNMVRAGAVKHPKDWEFCGYNEILDPPGRYQLIDRNALLSCCGITDPDEFRMLDWLRPPEKIRLTCQSISNIKFESRTGCRQSPCVIQAAGLYHRAGRPEPRAAERPGLQGYSVFISRKIGLAPGLIDTGLCSRRRSRS